MSGKFIIRRIIDIAMTAAIVLLMASQITGQTAHEWMGISMFLLFIIHTVLNHVWYKNLLKGKYQPVRVLQTIINLALLVSFVLTAVSGILMSQKAVPFLRIGSAVGTARALHLGFSHWTFLLISVHLGLHWGMITRKAQKHRGLWTVLSIAGVVAAGYGLLLTIRSQVYSYMLFQVLFAFLDYGASPVRVILENILMMASWAMISYEITKILRKPAKNDPHRRWISLAMIALEFVIAGIFSIVA